MKTAILLSGGKDSLYAAYLAKKKKNKLVCAITIYSKNPDSYMFHTPSISKVGKQARVMGIPLITQGTKGKKEEELKDLEKAIKKAIKKYGIEAITTGALHSDYQAKRIQKICDKLKIKCLNPLWHKEEIRYLSELVKNKFKVIITAVAAYPLDKYWLGKKIDKKFIQEVKELKRKYKIHPAGEGGEFETFVLNCPLFKKALHVTSFKDFSTSENSHKRELKL